MKKLTALLAGVAVLALAVSAFAGSAEKCAEDTQTCLEHMAAKLQKKGYMGLEFDKSNDGQYVIKRVMEGAPAAEAGFKAGDIILSVNDAKWDDEEAMKKIDWSVGSKMSVKVERAGKKQMLNITLAKMPEEVMAGYIGQHMLRDHVAMATAENR